MRCRPWIIAPLVCAALPAFGLDPQRAVTQYVHDAWQSGSGLPQNTVNAVLQTRDGYLWLGTHQGLARFDGVRFTVFDTGSTPELGNNYVLSLLEDRAGRLWIGTNGGGLVRLDGGRFTRYGREHGLPGDPVRALYEDRSGRLWVGTLGGGLLRRDGERFVREEWAERLPGRRIRAVLEDKEGLLWLGTDAGLSRVRDAVVTSFTTKQGLSHDSILTLLEDSRGRLWIGTEGGGADRLEAGVFKPLSTRQGLSDDIVWALVEDRQGNVWIGTQRGGLNRWTNGRLATLTAQGGLSINFVRSLWEDREGSLWVGTYGGGLNRLRDGRMLAVTTREGLRHDAVQAVYEDRARRVWVGTQGGLDRLEGERQSMAVSAGLDREFVRSLAEDTAGDLWIGTQGGGLRCLRKGRLLTLTTREGLANDVVLALWPARDGSLWIGTRGGGLNRLRHGRLERLGTHEGLSHDDVRCLLEASDGSLWIGTNGGGLDRLKGGRLTALTTREGLSNDFVWSLYEDAEGSLWIGTQGGGLNRLKDGKLAAIGTPQGLFADDVLAILEDSSQRLWLSGNRGISCVARSELVDVLEGRRPRVVPTTFGRPDGMRREDCSGASQPTAWRAHDGRLYFATSLGLVVIDPDRLPRNTLPPPVSIEEVVVDGRASRAEGALRLQPGTRSLEIHYTALSLRVPERVRFRYRLQGYDEDWIDPGLRRAAYYTSLPHGQYTFQVIASNDDGVWNRDGAALRLTVAPRWHETLAFRLLAVTTFLSVGPLFYRYRMQRMRRQQAELERVVAARTAEVEAANARLAQLSREDPLTGVANRRRLDEALDEEWRRAVRVGTPLVFQLIDVDAFKAYNDRLGHNAGDDALRAVAQALSSAHQRAGEIVARYGGEEFAILVPGAARERVAGMAEATRGAIEALGIPHPESPAGPVVTVSVGAAWVQPTGESAMRQLVAAADRALYRSKAAGRNRADVELL